MVDCIVLSDNSEGVTIKEKYQKPIHTVKATNSYRVIELWVCCSVWVFCCLFQDRVSLVAVDVLELVL